MSPGVRQLRILNLQPYWDGSHRNFSEGWQRYSQHQWVTLTLPARHWKWRMRHAAIEFAQQVDELDEPFDVVFCTDMLNVAEFKGLVNQKIASLPTVVYFHENQFAYPNQIERERDLHFGFTNFTTALAADGLWFNSKYNRDSFVRALREAAKRWPDYAPNAAIDNVERKSQINYPGIEFDATYIQRRIPAESPLHLLWCARWEHDKNPDDLLAALQILKREKFDFRLSLIGQSFREIPTSIKTIQAEFQQQLVHWGFQKTKSDYWQVLCQADVFTSTAIHEFFGLSAIESIIAGARPMLPDRLSYPEIAELAFGESRPYLYDGTPEDLAEKIMQLDVSKLRSVSELRESILKLHWQQRARDFDTQLVNLIP